MFRSGAVLAVVLASAFCGGAAGAAGQAPSTTSDPALDLFEQSARAYREGRFEEAVEKLLEARKLKPEPVLLYNLARAYEALGRWEDAANAYTQYLDEEPGAADRRAIEGRIATLRTQAAELAAARRPETKPVDDRAPGPATPGLRDRDDGTFPAFVPWAVAGAGIAVAGAGFGIGAAARTKHDDAVAEPIQQRAADLQESAEALAGVSTVMIVVGAVLVASGASWLIVRATSTTSTTSPAARAARLSVNPASLRWTF